VIQQRATIKTLQILHRALLLGVVLFAAIAFFLQYTGKFSSPVREKDQLLQLIAIAVCFAGGFIGASVFKKRILQTRNSQQSIAEKAAAYRSASIIQWALLEGPAIFCIICFLLVGNLAFLALAAAVLFWLALTGPSKIKIMLLLRLAEEDMENF
jgi:hypothetical protein